MKPSSLLALLLLTAPVLAKDDTPVPPEIQTLAETFVTAFKSGEAASVNACWHTAEALGKALGNGGTQDPSTSTTPIDASKAQEKETKRQARNLTANLERIIQLRALITKHFGDLSQLKLVSLEIDKDDEAPATAPRYDSADIRVTASDGTQLKLGMDDIVQIEGVWKFKGRIENDLTIELPES
jgi:hypothetical protein